MIQQFLSDLRQFLPSDRIYTDELRTLGWGTDASFYRQIPKVVIRSDGEEEISKIVKACQKHKLPFTFRAAGTSLSGQSCTDSVLIVAGKHWEKYEIGENQDTIKLQPGIVGARVNEILKPHKAARSLFCSLKPTTTICSIALATTSGRKWQIS